MRKYLWAYAPSLGELWLIMLALVCLGGSMVTTIASIILTSFTQIPPGAIPLVLYPLLFAVAIPFIWIRAKNSYEEKICKGEVVAEGDSRSFGSLSGPVFFILLLVLTPAFAILAEPLTMWMKMPDFIKKLFEELTNHGWLSVLALVVWAPLLEEWLCRKVAINGLLKRGYSPRAAIVWSACMFAVIHMNPWQAVPAFLMGLLFGWIYWKTRSLWAVIFMHAVNNGLSVALALSFPHLPEDASTYDVVGAPYYYWILAAAALIVGSIVWVLYKKLPCRNPS
ncbi:MAG: CPBP family intramembrane metalloprotease [Bacteroidales bacterium]|nr:CPBP family intramembrane metalloprotease [Bacteroidales bacterium]